MNAEAGRAATLIAIMTAFMMLALMAVPPQDDLTEPAEPFDAGGSDGSTRAEGDLYVQTHPDGTGDVVELLGSDIPQGAEEASADIDITEAASGPAKKSGPGGGLLPGGFLGK